MEWKGYNDYGTTAALSNHLNFQLRLAEGSNTVTTVYGPTYNISTTSRTNQIGLRGASNVDFNNRSGVAGNPWVSTSAGTANSATVARDNTNYPVSGLTFTWTPQTCFAPLNLNVTNVGLTTADLAWSASVSAPAEGYDVYYSAVNTAPTGGTVLNASNSVSSTTLSASPAGLSTGTTYYVWLRSKCSSVDVGPWGYSGVFTTLCSVFTAPYTQNFDNTNVGSTTNNVAPNCWSYVEPAGFAGYGYVIASNANSAPNSFYMYNSTGSSGNQMLVSPPTLNLSDGTRRVKFTAKSSSANYTVQVGTLSDPTDPTSYTAIGSAISLTTTHTEYIINIPAGTNQYLAFRHGLGANNRGIYIDNISVENVPTCLEPTALQSTAGSQTSTSGVVTWTAPATTSPTGYEIYYSTVNTAPTAATVLDAANSLSVTGTTATVSGLAPSTTYYIWVRSVCSATDKSIWTQNSVNFRTLCQPPTVTGITVSPNPVCINGMATLTANTVTGATINWYSDATSVTPLATGTNYTTAPLAATTNYYVSASTASSDQVGPVNPSALGGISASNYAIATYYQIFNVTVPTTLISVDVFPVSTVAIGTTSSIEIRDSAGTSLVTVPYTVSVNDGVTPQTVTLNFPLPVGTGYRIGQGTGINLNRNTSGAAYPFTSGAITVTGNNFDPDYWYYIYNWNFITSCESPRTMVTATVDPGCTMGTSETAGAKATVMYPNPFTDVLNISDVKNVKSISVLDISGRVVKSIDKPTAQIHLGDLKSGMYLISLQYKDGSVQPMKAIKK